MLSSKENSISGDVKERFYFYVFSYIANIDFISETVLLFLPSILNCWPFSLLNHIGSIFSLVISLGS